MQVLKGIKIVITRQTVDIKDPNKLEQYAKMKNKRFVSVPTLFIFIAETKEI